MLQFPIMTAQEIALDAAFAFAAPHTVLECCFNLFHIRSCRLLICKSFWFSTESENWQNEKDPVGVFGSKKSALVEPYLSSLELC